MEPAITSLHLLGLLSALASLSGNLTSLNTRARPNWDPSLAFWALFAGLWDNKVESRQLP